MSKYEFNQFDHDNHTNNDFREPFFEGNQQEQGGSGQRRKPNKKKGSGNGRRFASVAAMALTFGLIAGGTSYGVNYAANRLHPITAEGSAEAGGNSGSENGTFTAQKTQGALDKTATSADGSMTVAEVAASAMPSMVTISTLSVQEVQNFFGGTQQYEVPGAGTGVIVGEDDSNIYIATNNHVVEGAKTLSVGFIDESVVSGTIKGTDVDNDLAVVSVAKKSIGSKTLEEIKVITVGDSDALGLGDQVVAIGNALGYGQSVTSGYVSALNRELQLSDGSETITSSGLIQTDAAINAGNSGGALLNMQGELVGINEAKSSSGSGEASVDNMGFAIPLAKAQSILNGLIQEETKEKVDEDKRGYLGASVTDVTSQYAQAYNMPEGVGVTAVNAGGAAEAAGMQRGDVITKVGGKSCKTTARLKEQLQYYAAGDTVEVVFQRRDENGQYKEQTVSVTLESRQEALSGQEDPFFQMQKGENQLG